MVFKCKMCGGDIEVIESSHTGKCLYCKSVMTLPNLDDERIVNLYNRANNLRMSNEFDKAYEVYESILSIDNEQVEAHWGLILCKYGVEYVDDPVTKGKIPTCHRTLQESVLADSNFKFIKKNSYGEALKLYEKEANEINEIQKGILEISSKEEPYDIFICYKETDSNNERTHDSVMAQDIYDALTKEGYKVFFSRITLEDKLGVEYEPYIFSALTSAKVMLAIGTCEEHYDAVWVKNEWSRYLEFMKKDKSKTLIPVYSKMDAYKLPESFAMLQAQNMDKVGAMQDLIRGVKKIIDASKTKGNVDDDVLKKVKAALDEESSLGNNKYEVTEVKEKLPTWYYLFVFAASFAFLFCKAFAYEEIFFRSYFTGDSIGIERLDTLNVSLEVIVCLICIIACLFKVKSRKTYKIANYMYFVIPIIEVIVALLVLNRGYIVHVTWLISIFISLLLYFMNPKWHLDSSSKLIVDKEQKEKIQAKNNMIRDSFTSKEKYVIKIRYFFIAAFISGILYFALAYFYFLMPQGNKRDETVLQIKIAYERLNIRKFKETATGKIQTHNSTIVGVARKDEIYTVLSKKYKNDNDCWVWYEIKTRNNIHGYVCGSGNGINYVDVLSNENENLKDEFSNSRDTSKRQLEITNDYINIRSGHSIYHEQIGRVQKGQIYTILDEYKEGYIWYKIETSNGIKGWIAGTQNGVELVKIYEAE